MMCYAVSVKDELDSLAGHFLGVFSTLEDARQYILQRTDDVFEEYGEDCVGASLSGYIIQMAELDQDYD